MSGYIKLSRQLLDWEYADDPQVVSLWIHLLLKAEYKDGSYKGTPLKAGQVITGRKKLASQTGMTEQQIRRGLAALQNNQQITIKSTNKFSIITIRKWKSYQHDNQQKAQRRGGQTTTSKEDKNYIYIYYAGVSEKLWEEYLGHRIAVGAAMTDRALKSVIKQLDEWKAEGHQPEPILRNSMANGWKGIFKPKEQKNAKTGTSGKERGGKSERIQAAKHQALRELGVEVGNC